MPLAPIAWTAVSLLAAVALAAWKYGWREEPVAGRIAPATLHASAVFLLLEGLVLPALPVPDAAARRDAVLLDRSASMALPSTPGSATSRFDSALRLLDADPARVRLAFGAGVASLPSGGRLEPSDSASRLIPALAAARRAGATRVRVLTDGELGDRGEAAEAAERWGLAVEEIRVAAPVARVSVASVSVPPGVRSGDTLRVSVELRATGSAAAAAGSVTVSARVGRDTARVRVPTPAPGRVQAVSLDVGPVGGEGWRPLDVGLDAAADPLRSPGFDRTWIEVDPDEGGAVLLGLRPDWEPAALLPALAVSVPGGARGFLRLAPGRWVEMGPRPRPASERQVRASASTARLLVLETGSQDGPGWLGEVAAARPAVLYLVRGPGPLPGSGRRAGDAPAGEWYPVSPVPDGPVAGYLAGLALAELPPVGGPRRLEPAAGEWTALEVARDRRGDPETLAAGWRERGERRVAVLGDGTWRWAARAPAGRNAYRSLYAGLAGWLLGGRPAAPVVLAGEELRAGDPIRWRVAPGVRDLVLTVEDSSGTETWRTDVAEPPAEIEGPALRPGDGRFTAAGRTREGPFRTGRPFHADAPDLERSGRTAGAPLHFEPADAPDRDDRGRRAVWPFALAVAALGAEWAWRRRLGLR